MTTIEDLKCTTCARDICDKRYCPCSCHRIIQDRPCVTCTELTNTDNHNDQCECDCHED